MNIVWYGHACFCVDSQGYRIVLDPYDGVRGYPPLQLQAQQVLCSHEHFDHHHLAAVTLCPASSSPFSVETVSTFHDDRGGALRGSNTVHILRAEGLTVVHLGDLGHRLSDAQAQPLTGCDVLLIPVGGTYTIDGELAYETVRQLRPRIAVPMHYRRGEFGFDNVDTAEPFLSHFPAQQIHRLSGSGFDPRTAPDGVVLPVYPAAQ